MFKQVYECGCVSTHRPEQWASVIVDHCPRHSWTGDEFTEQDENPAHYDGIAFVRVEMDEGDR